MLLYNLGVLWECDSGCAVKFDHFMPEYRHIFRLQQGMLRLYQIIMCGHKFDGVHKPEVELLVGQLIAEFSC